MDFATIHSRVVGSLGVYPTTSVILLGLPCFSHGGGKVFRPFCSTDSRFFHFPQLWGARPKQPRAQSSPSSPESCTAGPGCRWGCASQRRSTRRATTKGFHWGCIRSWGFPSPFQGTGGSSKCHLRSLGFHSSGTFEHFVPPGI